MVDEDECKGIKISEFIKRLQVLEDLAGSDLEVTIKVGDLYETAWAEIYNVVPLKSDSCEEKKWVCLEKNNTEEIVVVM